jgi:opacity protein-like surface antigen
MRYLKVILPLVFILSATSLFAQSDRRTEVFVGYSNLQAQGLLNTDSVTGFLGSEFLGNRTTLHGFNTEVSAFLTDNVALTGNFSFNENSQSNNLIGADSIKTDILYFMGGPTLSIGHSSRLQPFVRFLAGGAQTRFNVKSEVPLFSGSVTNQFNTSTTNFALGAGGGLDWRVADRLKVRLFQVDYVPVFLNDQSISTLTNAGALSPFNLNGNRMDNVRFSVGIVF